MQRSRGLSAALVLSTAAGLGLVALPQPAAALTPPVAFTADDLPTWQTNGIVWALAEAHGTVFAGGTFSQVRPPDGESGTAQTAVNFVALDAATGDPTSCKLSFTIGSGTATVRALAVSPDKKTLYAGGYFGAVNGTQVSSLAAIDIATCTPKANFHPSVSATVRALAVTDDTVYLGGDFSSVAGSAHARYAAVDATSGAVKPFQADVDEPGRAVAVTPDGKDVILGGDFFTVNGANSHALAVVDATTGANVRTYPGFIETNSVVKALDTDGTGFYTGNEGTGGGVFDGRIALDLSTLDQRWRDTCLGATQAVKSYQDVLYSASHAHDCSSVGEFPDGRRHHLLAEPTTGTNKLGWFPDTNDGLGEGIGPRAMVVSETSDNKYMWVGGEFTTVNGSAAQGLTRFAASPDTGAPTVPSVSAESVKPTETHIRWRASLDTDDTELTYKVYRNGGSTPVYTVDGDSVEWSRPQLSFTDKNVTAGSTYTYRVTATDGAGNASALSAAATVTVPTSAQKYAAKVLDDGANLYWRYDESATPFVGDTSPGDQSGIHLNGPSLRHDAGRRDRSVHRHRLRRHRPDRLQRQAHHGAEPVLDRDLVQDDHHPGRQARRVRRQHHTRQRPVRQARLHAQRRPAGLRRVDRLRPHRHLARRLQRRCLAPRRRHPGSLRDGALRGRQPGRHTRRDQQPALQRVLARRRRQPQRMAQPALQQLLRRAGRRDRDLPVGAERGPGAEPLHPGLGPADSVQTVSASDDTYVNAGAAGTNYGTSTSLAVRGSAAYETYLRFDLPSAPAGTVLKSARLAVKTTTLSSAGSTDDISVRPVTGSWTEAGTTFTSRPAVSSTVVGTLSGATDLSTVYSATLDTAALTPALGGAYDLALTSTGADALWLWSSEAPAAENTPQLVLTFGAP